MRDIEYYEQRNKELYAELAIAIEALKTIKEYEIYKTAFPEYPITEVATEALKKLKAE